MKFLEPRDPVVVVMRTLQGVMCLSLESYYRECNGGFYTNDFYEILKKHQEKEKSYIE